MDRLTTVNGNNNIELVINESRVRIKDTDTLAVAKKLKEYEDMEESGNLLRSPCRLGDTVYILNQKRIIPLKICEIYFDSHGIEMAAKNREELGYRTINLTEDGIGVEWYKTEEEAEAAMNKLKVKIIRI